MIKQMIQNNMLQKKIKILTKKSKFKTPLVFMAVLISTQFSTSSFAANAPAVNFVEEGVPKFIEIVKDMGKSVARAMSGVSLAPIVKGAEPSVKLVDATLTALINTGFQIDEVMNKRLRNNFSELISQLNKKPEAQNKTLMDKLKKRINVDLTKAEGRGLKKGTLNSTKISFQLPKCGATDGSVDLLDVEADSFVGKIIKKFYTQTASSTQGEVDSFYKLEGGIETEAKSLSPELLQLYMIQSIAKNKSSEESKAILAVVDRLGGFNVLIDPVTKELKEEYGFIQVAFAKPQIAKALRAQVENPRLNGLKGEEFRVALLKGILEDAEARNLEEVYTNALKKCYKFM